MHKFTTSYKIYVSLYVEVWIWVLSVICPTTAWAGTLGYTAGSALSHTTHTHNAHTYIHTHKHTHSKSLLSGDLSWATTSGQLPKSICPHKYTLQREEGRVLWQFQFPQCPNPQLSLSLCTHPALCAMLTKRTLLFPAHTGAGRHFP